MSNDLNLDPINRALLGKRFAQWIDIVDKMREDRYTPHADGKHPFRCGESKL